MDARRFDRNADQLAQIYWHLNRIKTYGWDPLDIELLENYKSMIESCLQVNDMMGEKAGQGLI